MAGAHETALQPIPWPLKMSAPQVPSSEHRSSFSIEWGEWHANILLKDKTDSFPSDEAQATIAPSSWGAHETELTFQDSQLCANEDRRWRNAPEAVCRLCSFILSHVLPCCDCWSSFQINTFPSYEHDARMCPYFGCAQATCQTGPLCLYGYQLEVRSSRVTTNDEPLQGLPWRRFLLLTVDNVKHLDSPV